MKHLTKRQAEVLAFIEKFVHEHAYAPTFREIQNAFSFSSVGTVAKQIQSLQKKGYLTPASKKARGAVPASIESKPATAPNMHLGTVIPLIGAISPVRIELFQQPQTAIFPCQTAFEKTYAFLIKANEFTNMQQGDLIAIGVRSAFPKETVLATCKGVPKIGVYDEDEAQITINSERFSKHEVSIYGVLFSLVRSYETN